MSRWGKMIVRNTHFFKKWKKCYHNHSNQEGCWNCPVETGKVSFEEGHLWKSPAGFYWKIEDRLFISLYFLFVFPFLLYHKPGIWYPNECRMNHLFPFSAFPILFRCLVGFFLSVKTTLMFRTHTTSIRIFCKIESI